MRNSARDNPGHCSYVAVPGQVLISRSSRLLPNCCIRYDHKRFLLFAILLVIVSIVVLSNICIGNVCDSPESTSSTPLISSLVPSFLFYQYRSPRLAATKNTVDRILLRIFSYDFDDYQVNHNGKLTQIDFDYIIKSNRTFDLNSTDVMVFLHMQKTGGSAFDRHLVRDLILPQACKCDAKRKKKCRCFRPGTNSQYWLFSRYSIGWKCGLHADYTELANCVDRVLNQVEHATTSSLPIRKRHYYYVALLRDPVARFLSEFKHVQRGATWKTSRHWCDGRLPTRKELPSCFSGSNWRNVTLEEFISCPDNLAFNRQTRMLADLSLVGCYNRSVMSTEERDSVMLFSAKQNLKQMAFFGLCEEQLASQYLFEQTFRLRFKRAFVQFNQTRSRQVYSTLSTEMIGRIRQLNYLDMALYSYAKQLFRKRFSFVKEIDRNFDSYFSQLLAKSQSQLKRSRQNRSQRDQTSTSSRPLQPAEDDDYDDSAVIGADIVDDSVEDYYH